MCVFFLLSPPCDVVVNKSWNQTRIGYNTHSYTHFLPPSPSPSPSTRKLNKNCMPKNERRKKFINRMINDCFNDFFPQRLFFFCASEFFQRYMPWRWGGVQTTLKHKLESSRQQMPGWCFFFENFQQFASLNLMRAPHDELGFLFLAVLLAKLIWRMKWTKHVVKSGLGIDSWI